MQEKVPTVKIECDGEYGYRIINESDFNPKIHKLIEDEAAPKKTPALKVETEKFGEPVGPFTVGKNGKRGGASKYVIFNMIGERIAADEYDTEALAWAASLTLSAAPQTGTGG